MKPVIEWQPCIRTGAYIKSNHQLYVGSVPILITYETAKGKRYVKAVRCVNGRVSKQINGDIIAWSFMPDPYDGDPETVEEYTASQSVQSEEYLE